VLERARAQSVSPSAAATERKQQQQRSSREKEKAAISVQQVRDKRVTFSWAALIDDGHRDDIVVGFARKTSFGHHSQIIMRNQEQIIIISVAASRNWKGKEGWDWKHIIDRVARNDMMLCPMLCPYAALMADRDYKSRFQRKIKTLAGVVICQPWAKTRAAAQSNIISTTTRV
jgi:hypothetical protein